MINPSSAAEIRGRLPLPDDLQHQGHFDHLRTVNLHLRMVVDQISEGAMILEAVPLSTLGPRVVFLNRGLCRLVGCRAEDLLGQPLAQFFEAERLAEFLAVLPRVAEAGKAFLTRAFLLARSGGRKYCRWTVSCIRDSAGRPLNFIITVAEQATAMREATCAPVSSGPAVPLQSDDGEEYRVHELARLESLEVIASGIAHDFRNHLTAVMLNISNAGALTGDSESQRRFLADATVSAQHAKALADQLMEFARGGTPLMKVVDIAALIADCVRLALSGSRCVCHVDVASDLWPAKVDPTRVKQVINNLLINACQAMMNGGTILATAENVTLKPETGVDAKPGPYVLVRVHDRGEGIPPEVLPNIFKRNFTTKKTGNGLGLASSYHIIRSHQGAIMVSSKPNVGTEFRVYLPACPAEVPIIDEKAKPVLRTRRRGSGAVLIVDDQHVVRAAVKASLLALGYETEEAANGELALECYRRRLSEGRPFQIVLMDLTLPGAYSGNDALREIRSLDPGARVIASSGAFEAEAVDSYRQLGYVGILPKPFDVERLAAALEQAERVAVMA
ncbi:MAG: hybrid sensor histidine kinase/response regulator [Verrucomicrobiales bacterium]